MLIKIGNENANNFWEWNASEDDRIDHDVDMWVMSLLLFCSFTYLLFYCFTHWEKLARGDEYKYVSHTYFLLWFVSSLKTK